MSCQSPHLIFDFADHTERPRRLAFNNPERIITATSVGEVRAALRAVQAGVDEGLYAAGYIAYEAAPAFDPALKVRNGCEMPLVWFGLFRQPAEAAPGPAGRYTISNWTPATGKDAYDSSIASIREAIASGATYQANYTIRLRAHFEGDDFALYERLRAAQGGSWCAYLNTGRHRILSASPELFLRRHGCEVVTRPMKGTRRRGRWPEEDDRHRAWLMASEKDRAENLMIVDLLRNDLGRVAEVGSVNVPALFSIERYRTVFQMTSTVASRVPPSTTFEDLLAALFPCGSVTGAPKVSTMKIIAELEDSPRNVYCGAIGFIEPGGDTAFNVAIRTVVIDTETGAAEYGVGGGITWDSTASAEYDEVLAKAAVLFEAWPQFELLETILLEDGRYALLERHLSRLERSAVYFDIPASAAEARKALEQHAARAPQGKWRVRLLVSQDGHCRVEGQPIVSQADAPRAVCLARAPVSRNDRFLFHKTTNRAVYDAHRSLRPDVFDVLLWNEEGELTEFTNGNVVAELDGRRWTPPVDCGLLAGTFRAELLDRGEIAERVIPRSDIERVSRWWFINGVRGWVPVHIVP